MSKRKTPRWHIDYLTNKASMAMIVTFESKGRLECTLAQVLRSEVSSVGSFGSSDCDCGGHLFFARREQEMDAAMEKVLDAVQVQSTVLVRQDFRRYLGLNRR